ncbi:glycosyltransferase family 4 protein [Clostridium polynesiense]|uniref:glycosyltransferase family 4 protein n=1 Tax=Clostridium polynesiense TaxID=1325933 RepID=UPI000590FDA0|nr:glycosyltransferase family 4 protein [Clostridium polynesiense]
MNIAFIGIRVDYRTTLSAPKRIANKLYEEIKKLNKDTFFYSLPWDSEGITQEDAKNGETVGSLSGIRDFILKNKIQTVYLSRYYSKLALYMVLLKKIYKFKLIYTVHGLIKKESDINGTFKGYGGMVERLLLNNCDGIAAVSEEAKEEILKYYPHLDPSIIEVINNGVEIPED